MERWEFCDGTIFYYFWLAVVGLCLVNGITSFADQSWFEVSRIIFYAFIPKVVFSLRMIHAMDALQSFSVFSSVLNAVRIGMTQYNVR